MAASPGLSLVSPLRLWAVSNILLVAFMGSSWLSSYKLAAQDNLRLAQAQAQTLTKSAYEDLKARRFRDFVEGIGAEFGDLYVRVSIGAERFEFGQESGHPDCGRVDFPLAGASADGQAHVAVCRPFRFALWPFFVIFGSYATISGLYLLVARRLDRSATVALAGLLRESGVEVDARDGLLGIGSRIRSVREQLDASRRRERELAGAEARAQLAEQVAHDLRSPLAALQHLAARATIRTKGESGLFRSSVGRLSGIAEDLLGRHRRSNSADTARPAPVPLWPLIEASVAEKRLELHARPSVRLELTGRATTEKAEAAVDGVQFQRVLSNLLNNAVEAMGGEGGCVSVGLTVKGARVILRVEDDGPGFSADIAAKAGRRGTTLGKEGGNGLGLHYASQAVESWAGRLAFGSKPGAGAAVVIDLPASSPRLAAAS